MARLAESRLRRAWARTRRLARSPIAMATLWWCLILGLLEHRFPALRSSSVRTVSITDNGVARQIRLRANGMDAITFWEVLVAQVYQVALPLPPGATIVDVGANIGLTSVFLADRTPGARLVAVEPEPTNFALLRRNLEGLGASLHEAAASPDGGRQRLARRGPTAHQLADDDRAADGTLEVQTFTLDELAEHNSLRRVDLLKVDIEGAEWPLIERGAQLLERTDRIVMEIHEPGDRRRIADVLAGLGFSHRVPDAPGIPDLFHRSSHAGAS